MKPEIFPMPKDPDLLPKKGVKDFVERFAQANQVTCDRTKINDLAEAITKASGDSVKLDATSKLLISLKKQNLIDARQLARLLTNHAKETQNV